MDIHSDGVLLLLSLFYVLFSKGLLFKKIITIHHECPCRIEKSHQRIKNGLNPIANVRKMLLMKNRSFLYKLRAYLIYVKVGERSFLNELKAYLVYLVYVKVREKFSSWRKFFLL